MGQLGRDRTRAGICDRSAIGRSSTGLRWARRACNKETPMIIRRPLRLAAVVAVALAATLVACGSSSSTAAGAPSTASTSPSTAGQPSAASTTGPTGAGSAQPIDVCATLTAASAAELSGQPITTASEMTEQAPLEYGCGYSSADRLCSGAGSGVRTRRRLELRNLPGR